MQQEPESQTSSPRTSEPASQRQAASGGQNAAGGASPERESQRAPDGESGTPVVEKARQAVGNIASKAGEQVSSRIDEQKTRTADGLGSLAQVLRESGQRLGDDEGTAIRPVVEKVAEQVERFSAYLRTADPADVVDKVEDFARRQPALFFGGAFALGLLTARFLKSSADAGGRTRRVGPGQTAARRADSMVPRTGARPLGPGSVGYESEPARRPSLGGEGV